MALTSKFVWQNSDSTLDLNDRLRVLVKRGIYFGGNVTPGVGLQVLVAPFLGVGYDGVTVSDSAITPLNVMAGTTQYVVVRVRYNSLGVPAVPTMTWQVLTAADYAVDPEKDYLIVFAVVTLALGAVNVVLADIDISVRDEVTQVGRAWFRGVAANSAALPLPPPTQNLVGDHYYVIADNTFYFWTGAIWSPMSSAGYNSETILNNRDLVDNEIQRLTNNSGLISGTRNGTPGFLGSKLEISVDGTPGVDDSINIDTFATVVYGHTIVTKATTLALPAHPVPAAPDRYDLVFLEVWREALAVPETYGYERNPTGVLTYTLPQATDVAETAYTPGFAGGNNFDFNTVGTYGHAGYVLKYRFGVKSGVANTAIYDPITPVAGWLVPNVDATANFGTIAGENRIWASTPAPSSVDDRTWAMPLLVLRRHNAEAFGGDPIVEYRNGTRYIFPIHPVADVAKLGRDLADTTAVSSPLSASFMDVGNPTLQPNEKPSGFITGMDYPVGPGVAVDTLKFYNEAAKFRIRGFEDWTRFNVDEFDLSSPAVGVGNYARTLVYIEMSVTLYQDDDSDPAKKAGYYTSRTHRPLIPNYLLSGVVNDVGQGWRRGFVTYRVRAQKFSNLDYRDADDAMAASGWSKGDLFLLATNPELAYQDGGLWSKTIALTADNRIHPFLTQWAIPVALVHRRNSAAWAYDTNPNGSAGRPDGHTNAQIIHADDLVDLRCTVDIDEGTLAKRLAADFDRNMKGQLRTRLANRWASDATGVGLGGEVAGSRILQTDAIAAAPVLGAFPLTAPDGYRLIWSDAKEFMPVCAVIPNMIMNYNIGGPDPNLPIEYTTATGVLKLAAPEGAHLVRHLPAAFIAGGVAATNYLQFNGPPLWATRHLFERANYPIPTGSSAKALQKIAASPAYYLEVALDAQAAFHPGHYLNFDAPGATLDSNGHAIETTITFTAPYGAADVLPLSWWVHYDRSLNDVRYASNYGLAEIPDEVHLVQNGAAELHIGTIYTVVRKSVLAAATSCTITDANVTASSGTPGAVRLMGVAIENMRYSGTPAGVVTTVIMNDAQDEISINWSLAFGADMDIDIIVFYETVDVNKWVDIGRGGKSVMGPFEWHETEVNLSTLAADGPVAVALHIDGTRWWRHADVAGMLIEMPIVWQRVAAGDWYLVRLHQADAWAAAPPAQDPLSVGYPFSNMMSLSMVYPNASGKDRLKIVSPVSSPSSTDILIHYTYTPYQGLSSSGGAITNPIPAGTVTTDGLARTKALLHGTVLHNTDWVVTQSGPCSKWGGVDSWTGWPTREPDRYLNFSYSAFADFNSPRLVRSTAQQGLQDTFGRNYTNTNAAAVLRMPFPGGGDDPVNYPRVQEYDLDPGREGASCGWFSYAPGYLSVLTAGVTTVAVAELITEYVKRDQFVNGLTPLNSRSFQSQSDRSMFVPAVSFAPLVDNAADYGAIGHRFPYWTCAQNSIMRVSASTATRRNDVLCATALHLFNWAVPTDVTNANGDDFSGSALLMSTPLSAYGDAVPGLYATLAEQYLRDYQIASWPDAWPLGGGPAQSDVFLCHGCGTIHLYYLSLLADVQPLILTKLVTEGTLAPARITRGAYTAVEGNRAFTYGHNIPNTEAPGLRLEKPLDTITLPWSSGSRNTDHHQYTAYSHYPNYYADSSSTTLAGMVVQYPASWDNTTVATADSLLRASETATAGYGRGVYLRPHGPSATIHYRASMPVLAPGSGTPMNDVFAFSTTPNATAESPPSVPSAPAEAPFARTHRVYDLMDHGGAIAYCGFGLHMLPSADQYFGRVVMQISGGPLGQVRYPGLLEYGEVGITPDETSVDGTALDAFWPTGRPILTKR